MSFVEDGRRDTKPEHPCSVCGVETGEGNIDGASWWGQRLCYSHGAALESELTFTADGLGVPQEAFCAEAMKRTREWVEAQRKARAAA